MVNNSKNRRRAFADVVTIDAWHESFGPEVGTADLHADVVFGVARVSGETDSPVRFRLSIKRAEIIVLIPESEPVRVDKRSPACKEHLTQVVERAPEQAPRGAAGIGLSKDKFGGGAKLKVTAKAQQQTNSKLELTTAVELMIVVQSQTADGHYPWTVESPRSSVLVGRPWDANKQPRLKLVDKRKDRSKGIPPTVRVEVRCRREDLIIENLEIKDEGLWGSVKRKAGSQKTA